MIRIAILVDGAFYLRRANYLWGDKNPKDRARELVQNGKAVNIILPLKAFATY